MPAHQPGTHLSVCCTAAPLCVSLALLAFHPIHRYPQSPHSIQSVPMFLVHIRLTWASCSRSSSLVTVMERSQVYFLRNVSCSFCNCSSASRTSEKNWGSRKGHTRLTSPNPSKQRPRSQGRGTRCWKPPRRTGSQGYTYVRGYGGSSRALQPSHRRQRRSGPHLEVGCVLFQVCFNAATQL